MSDYVFFPRTSMSRRGETNLYYLPQPKVDRPHMGSVYHNRSPPPPLLWPFDPREGPYISYYIQPLFYILSQTKVLRPHMGSEYPPICSTQSLLISIELKMELGQKGKKCPTFQNRAKGVKDDIIWLPIMFITFIELKVRVMLKSIG